MTSSNKLTWVITCVAALAVGCAARQPVVAPGGMAQQGLMATGNGEAKGVPDIARVTLGVEVRAETAEQATTQTNQVMGAVMAALKATGVADADLRTQNYSVNFEQEPQPMPPQPTEKGAPAAARGVYRASNMVEVTVRDLSKLGAILARAGEAGANNVWGVSFEIEHPEALVSKARAQAMENAKRTAGELASLSGVKLGALISVTENGGGMPMPMMKTMNMRESAAQDVPMERGEITVTTQVQLLYALPD